MKRLADQAKKLFKIGEMDLEAFLVLKKSKKISPTIIYFHAQQAVEKYLKAILISNNIDPQRIHDLNELAYLLQRNHIPIPVSIEELSKLNPYAVIFRYDDMEIETIDRKEVEKLMMTIREWVRINIQHI